MNDNKKVVSMSWGLANIGDPDYLVIHMTCEDGAVITTPPIHEKVFEHFVKHVYELCDLGKNT